MGEKNLTKGTSVISIDPNIRDLVFSLVPVRNHSENPRNCIATWRKKHREAPLNFLSENVKLITHVQLLKSCYYKYLLCFEPQDPSGTPGHKHWDQAVYPYPSPAHRRDLRGTCIFGSQAWVSTAVVSDLSGSVKVQRLYWQMLTGLLCIMHVLWKYWEGILKPLQVLTHTKRLVYTEHVAF